MQGVTLCNQFVDLGFEKKKKTTWGIKIRRKKEESWKSIIKEENNKNCITLPTFKNWTKKQGIYGSDLKEEKKLFPEIRIFVTAAAKCIPKIQTHMSRPVKYTS